MQPSSVAVGIKNDNDDPNNNTTHFPVMNTKMDEDSGPSEELESAEVKSEANHVAITLK
jgi:hypothetical protein